MEHNAGTERSYISDVQRNHERGENRREDWIENIARFDLWKFFSIFLLSYLHRARFSFVLHISLGIPAVAANVHPARLFERFPRYG